MQICKEHWDDLSDAIRVRGLWNLVASNGRTAMYRIKQELEGRAFDSTFDPLMSANNMISSAAISCGGLYLLSGNYCPLCEADKNGASAVDWIKLCADNILEYCKERNLIVADE